MALIDVDGYPTASPIAVSKNEKINWLTICASLNSNKAKRIERSNLANVCFYLDDPLYIISLTGKIEIITDPEVKKNVD